MLEIGIITAILSLVLVTGAIRAERRGKLSSSETLTLLSGASALLIGFTAKVWWYLHTSVQLGNPFPNVVTPAPQPWDDIALAAMVGGTSLIGFGLVIFLVKRVRRGDYNEFADDAWPQGVGNTYEV